jgi:hypothetical protein
MSGLEYLRVLRKQEEHTGLFVSLCILALLTIPFIIALDGYAIATLWRWFVVPTFHLPLLSVPVALGVAGIARYVSSAHEDKNDTEEQSDQKHPSFPPQKIFL